MTAAPTIALIDDNAPPSLPGGALARVNGETLVELAIRQAKAVPAVSAVRVATSGEAAAAVARRCGAAVVPKDAPDLGPDVRTVVRLPVDAPIRSVEEIAAALALLASSGAERVVAAHALDDPSSPVRHRETGTIEATNRAAFDSRQDRPVTTRPLVVGAWAGLRVRTPADIGPVEAILRLPAYRLPTPWPERIALLVFDFDGVMTDNGVIVDQDGREAVRCDRSDGLGLAALRRAGMPMIVLSTEENPVVAARCRKLHLPCHQGIGDKEGYLRGLLAREGIDPAHVVYVGNDTNDLGCLGMVGLPVAVADAHPAVLPHARLILERPGGRGAVRELCDRLIEELALREAQGRVEHGGESA